MIIEEFIIGYLKSKLKIPVYAEIPKKKPDKFIVVEKTAGGITNQINIATISVYSYGNALFSTAELDEKVKETMFDIICNDEISSCKLGGEDRSIDTANKEYRYESIFNLYYYKWR